ncbi:vesicle-trafficking protein SEC22b-like [Halichondria panicea]|uniref:vesicle-trafficking protein SEC22b-like n=1 Tax=Halichondria panicea TaxID=6063 RepID=UPI00312B3961
MAHLTLIARASDGLPLSASIVNEESGRDYAEYQPKAKQIFRKLSSVSPPRCSIECDPGRMVFHYILEEGICYLALCDLTYPAKLAFNYLENLHKDFSEQHGNDVHKASRPYHFIEFDLSDKAGKLVDHSRVPEANG